MKEITMNMLVQGREEIIGKKGTTTTTKETSLGKLGNERIE